MQAWACLPEGWALPYKSRCLGNRYGSWESRGSSHAIVSMIPGRSQGHCRVTAGSHVLPHLFPWQLQTCVHVHGHRVWHQCSFGLCPATLLQTFVTECPKEDSKGNVSAAPRLYSIHGVELHVHTLYHGTSQVCCHGGSCIIWW